MTTREWFRVQRAALWERDGRTLAGIREAVEVICEGEMQIGAITLPHVVLVFNPDWVPLAVQELDRQMMRDRRLFRLTFDSTPH